MFGRSDFASVFGKISKGGSGAEGRNHCLQPLRPREPLELKPMSQASYGKSRTFRLHNSSEILPK